MQNNKQMIGITVNQFIANNQKDIPNATGDFSNLLNEIIISCKVIRSKLMSSGISEVLHAIEGENVHGDVVKTLDIIANDIFKERLLKSGLVSMIISEEDNEPVFPDDKYIGGKYIVAIDPCDGSSNIACNVPVGTIFGIWERKSSKNNHSNSEDILHRKRDILCGGYVLYGSSTVLVYTTGDDVNGFTYDPLIGEFILTHKQIRFPDVSKCYSVNESYYDLWNDNIKKYVNWLKSNGHTARYVGSLVADFHRNLLYGGVFLYPKDSKSKTGKLRLLYECIPLSFIAEQAGGSGTDGQNDILEVDIVEIHQKTPLFIGNKNIINKLKDF
jgi:fructose-1,6-bisphosphatase I